MVWADVTQRAYSESELNWTYLTFMTLATLLASIAIILDSQILVIGAMVLGPEFVAIAALGLALVRHDATTNPPDDHQDPTGNEQRTYENAGPLSPMS